MKRNSVQISEDLMKKAKIFAKVKHRSASKQIEHWAEIGKIVEDNPDLPLSLITEMLISAEEINQGLGTEYEFDN